MPRVFVYVVAVVSVLTCTAHAQRVTRDRSMNEPQSSGSSDINIREELFRKSFRDQRKEHAQAVKRLQKLDSYELLYKMIMILGEQIIGVIETGRTLIESSDFDAGNQVLPQNATIQSALSTVLENTALFGDIVLRFPRVTRRILKLQRNWNAALNWSLRFVNRTRRLLDKETFAVIYLMGQELNVTEREPGYANPFWPPAGFREGDEKQTKTRRSAKKEKRRRGPQMTKIEL